MCSVLRTATLTTSFFFKYDTRELKLVRSIGGIRHLLQLQKLSVQYCIQRGEHLLQISTQFNNGGGHAADCAFHQLILEVELLDDPIQLSAFLLKDLLRLVQHVLRLDQEVVELVDLLILAN